MLLEFIRCDIQTIIFLIVSIVYTATAFADEVVEKAEVTDSDFLQYKLQCTIDAPIDRVVPKAWNAALDSSFTAPKEIKTILDAKANEIVMHTYIPIFSFQDRDVVTCGKWDHKVGFESDSMSWKVCERHDAPIRIGAIRILKSNGSWSFHSNINGGTTITIKSHTDPGGYLPAWVVNILASDRLIDDCHRLRKRISPTNE